MASGPITSWEIDGEIVETVSDFILGGSKVTADGNCSHEIKICLLLGSKVMTNPDSILKSKNITLPTKVQLVKAMVFPVVMYGCESWIIKIVECQRMMILNLESILEEIGPECSMEVLMLKLELQYFGHVMQRADSFDKTLMLGKIGQEEKGTAEDERTGWHH